MSEPSITLGCSTLGCRAKAVELYDRLWYCSHHLLSVLNTTAMHERQYATEILDKNQLIIDLNSTILRYRERGECHDRNHVGLEDVMSGKRLPAPELGQNAAFVALVFGAGDRYRKVLEKIVDAGHLEGCPRQLETIIDCDCPVGIAQAALKDEPTND